MSPPSRHRWHLGTALVALALALGVACLSGINLGLFIGGLVLCTILAPYAGVFWDSPRHALIATACTALPITAVWLWATWADPAIHLSGCLGACGVIMVVAWLAAVLAGLLRRAGLGSASAAGLTVILALLWLLAPIWLFPHLQSASLLPWMQRLINIHPVFAINSALPLSIWSEMPTAYTVLNLNQDIPYTLPASPLGSMLVHIAIGLPLWLIWIKEQIRPRR